MVNKNMSGRGGKYLSLFVVLAMALAINTQSARAEDVDEDGIKEAKKEMREKRDEARVEIKAAREISKERIKELKAKIKEERDAARAKIKETRIIGRENALQKLDQVVEKIEKLKTRITAQIAKLEAKGVDVGSAESFLTATEEKLSVAEAKIAEANALLSLSIDELTIENRAKLGTMVREIQLLIKDAHKSLREAVKALKSATKIRIEAQASASLR
jgi:hypothetical protein